MKTKLMAMLLMAGSTIFAGVRFGVGVNLGVPVHTPFVVNAAIPPCPGPGYVWMNGYWAAPPYEGAYWVAPRYFGGHYVAGYWGGERHFDRDHFDRGRNFRR
jgi:hypothetical protein